MSEYTITVLKTANRQFAFRFVGELSLMRRVFFRLAGCKVSKVCLFLLLTAIASASPKVATPRPYASLAPVTHEILSDAVRIIDSGKRFEHVITYKDGRKVRFIYEVPRL